VTFDFAPDCTNTETAASTQVAAPPRLSVASKPTFAVAQLPTATEMVNLVAELFREGCLSWEQMRSLAELPDFGTALLDTLVASPTTQKAMAAE